MSLQNSRYMSPCVCEVPHLTVFAVIVRPGEGYYAVSHPKVFVYCKPGVSNIIRTFRHAVWFSQPGSGYWGRQNLRCGPWEYFNIRMEDFFVEQAGDASSNAGHSFFFWGGGVGGGAQKSDGRISPRFTNFRFVTTKFITGNWYVFH